MKYSIFILLFACILGFSPSINAQTNSAIPQTVVNVDMIPENPKPNEKVFVSLTSYTTDINTANITWKINGKVQASGIGLKTFTLSVGDANTTTTLDITAETREGETINKTFRIKPVTVDLIWESSGFVPAFYKGKSLFAHQNKINFIALPHITSGSGSELSAKSLVYTWKKNGTVLDDVSGYGKNTYLFTDPLISRPFEIEVGVTTPNLDSSGYASINVDQTDPAIVFYNKSPLYGVEFQKALQNTVTLDTSKELTVIAMPFFFGTLNSSSPELSYKWAINGLEINDGLNQSTRVFRQNEGTSGTSNISLSIENINKILQFTSSNFDLMFGNITGSTSSI